MKVIINFGKYQSPAIKGFKNVYYKALKEKKKELVINTCNQRVIDEARQMLCIGMVDKIEIIKND